MIAVIETGGKQYKILPKQKIKIEKLPAKEGEIVNFDKVLLIKSAKRNIEIGAPYVKNVSVEGRVLKQGKGEKKIVFRYHSKTRYRKKKGHKQPFTEVEILKIED